jgi:hypothetical protein
MFFSNINKIEKSYLNQGQKQLHAGQKKVTQFFTSEKVVVSHTKESFKAALVEIAVNNAIPLRFISIDGFLHLNGELAKKLQVVFLEHFMLLVFEFN